MHEIINEFFEFVDELVELMQEDWERFKKFVKEYKNYVFWFFVLLITMQFTDIITLGKYIEKMCNQNMIQKGGQESVLKLNDNIPGETSNDETKQAEKDKPEQSKSDLKEGKKLLQQMQKEQQGQQQQRRGQGQDDELKRTEKQLGFFKRMKQQITGVPGQRAGLAGPIFNSLNRSMDYMQNIVAVITFILTAIGIISLPVFIFLIASYYIIKKLAVEFLIL